MRLVTPEIAERANMICADVASVLNEHIPEWKKQAKDIDASINAHELVAHACISWAAACYLWNKAEMTQQDFAELASGLWDMTADNLRKFEASKQ